MKWFLSLILMFTIGCAVGAKQLRFQDRELLIHPDKPMLAYPYNKTECVDRKKPWRWLGKKCKKKHTIDEYDIRKKSVRDKLISAGFSCKSAMRFKY